MSLNWQNFHVPKFGEPQTTQEYGKVAKVQGERYCTEYYAAWHIERGCYAFCRKGFADLCGTREPCGSIEEAVSICKQWANDAVKVEKGQE